MAGFTGASPIVTDGLVFAVDAANYESYPGSGTTWSDLVGSNDGTLTNGPTYSSANGGSIVLDGTNDHVNFSDGSFLYPWSYPSLGITITAWVKFDAQSAYDTIIASDYVNNGTRYTIPFFMDIGDLSSSYIRMGHYGAGVSGTYPIITATTSQFNTGEWYYVVGSIQWTSTTTCDLKLYKNGSELTANITEVNSGLGAYNVSSNYENNGGWSIGQVASLGRYVDGNTSQVKIYNRALTSAEILQNYNALKSRFNL